MLPMFESIFLKKTDLNIFLCILSLITHTKPSLLFSLRTLWIPCLSTVINYNKEQNVPQSVPQLREILLYCI